MRNYIVPLTMLLVLAVVSGCGKLTSKTNKETDPLQNEKPTEEIIVIPIQAEYPTRGNISSHFETTTRVDAESRVQVLAETSGQCLKVHVEEGDTVKAGDILAELDQTDALATLGQTEVQVRQTKTAYDIAERSLAEGIGAKAECDNARFAHEQALAALKMQKIMLDKLTIRAPINGLVTRKNIQEGQLVAPGAPLFSIVDPQSYILNIMPPEKELARLKEGQIAKVSIDALGSEEFEATVRRINPGVDPLSGTVKVTLDFDKETRAKLREAAFARVRLIMETHENALLLAKDTLVEENARKYVFVVKKSEDNSQTEESEESKESTESKNTPDAAPTSESSAGENEPVAEADTDDTAEPARLVAERVEVQTGLEDSNFVEIISGIDDTSQVVTLGQHTLKHGAYVTITNAVDEIAEKAGLSAEEALEAAKIKRAGKKETSDSKSHSHD